MTIVLRPWRRGDENLLQRLANDASVSQWMTSEFRYPYTLENACDWIEACEKEQPTQHFAVEFDGTMVGGAGLEPHGEAAHKGVAIIGYWLGREYWGRGIGTAVVRTLVERAREAGFRRLQADVFESNIASARVLAKAGFSLEGRLRASYVERDGTPRDELVFGLLLVEEAQRH